MYAMQPNNAQCFPIFSYFIALTLWASMLECMKHLESIFLVLSIYAISYGIPSKS